MESVDHMMDIVTQEKQAYRTTDPKAQEDRQSQVLTLPPDPPALSGSRIEPAPVSGTNRRDSDLGASVWGSDRPSSHLVQRTACDPILRKC